MWQILFGIIFFIIAVVQPKTVVTASVGRLLTFVTTTTTAKSRPYRRSDYVSSFGGGIFQYHPLYGKLLTTKFGVNAGQLTLQQLSTTSNIESSDPDSTKTTVVMIGKNKMEQRRLQTKSLRMLALHGSGGTGTSLSEILQNWNIMNMTQHDDTTTTKDKPGYVTTDNDTIVSSSSLSSSFLDITTVTGHIPKEDGYSWWKLGEGERSFNADYYDGFEHSKELVLNALTLSTSSSLSPPQQQAPYDIIFGHSQGAILITALLALNAIGGSDGTILEQQPAITIPHPTIGYILNGVAWPNPYSLELESLQIMKQQQQQKVRILIIIGERDTINPPVQAHRVATALQNAGCDVTIVTHPNGHSIPTMDDGYNNNTTTSWGQSIQQWMNV